eukprot:TRINITY_DN11519_c0_g3_i4.p1 TRINITY_DN11519_c0_g3~~TRINITY_DN11519_c0_g3_i4.p1  ORF type:complete len:587 (+),score=133.92 TRINITY_DN11519_c0_g3_i4:2-1762(+)
MADRSAASDEQPKEKRSKKQDILRIRSKKAIRRFQQANDFQVTAPIAGLLPLMRHTRSELHENLFENVKIKCLARIRACSTEQLTAMLRRLWPHTKRPEIKPLVLEILNHHASIPDAYLTQLYRLPELLDECELRVKQQVWKLVPTVFVAKITPLLDKLFQELEEVWLDPHFAEEFAATAHRTSFTLQLPGIAELLSMVGTHLRLYNHVLTILRKRFKETGHRHVATLRLMLPLALARSSSAVFSKDPCYKFASQLEELANANNSDADKSRQVEVVAALVQQLAELKAEDPQRGDMCLLLLDPSCQQTLCRSLLERLKAVIELRQLPRQDATVRGLVELLDASVDVRAQFQAGYFNIPAANKLLVQEMLPLLTACMVDDAIMEKQDYIDGAHDSRDSYGDEIKACLEANPYMRLVLLRYICQRAQRNDQRRALDCHHQFIASCTTIPASLEVPTTAYLCQSLLTTLWWKAVANVNVVQESILGPLARKSMALHRLTADVYARAPEPFQEADSEQTAYHHLKQLVQEGVIDAADNDRQRARLEALADTYASACEPLSKEESDDVMLHLLSRFPKDLAARLKEELILD